MTEKSKMRLSSHSTIFRIVFSVLILVQTYIGHCTSTEIDENGYIAYCPCMGRFGNQADNFLGALGFSIALNRTLVIPPWVEYRTGATRSTQVPFNTYFNVSQLESCHRVIVMDEFMKSVAPIVWPESRRISFCYSVRGNTGSCNAKEGNPFGPFWDTFDVEFVGSEFYGPLHYDVHHSDMVDQWTNRYPPSSWPVLAFTGAPASFPVQMENKKLQKCVRWNDEISKKAKSYVKKHLPRGAYVGIHLRNGIDWTRACEFISSSPNLFAAPQCLGYRNERGKATVAMCLPPLELIIRHLKRVIRTNNDVKSIYVASDNNHMVPELSKALRRMEISVHKQEEPASPHLDLAILGNSNYFIGNCISSFSAFVAREREVRGLPTYFWGFPPERTMSSVSHEEL